MAAIAVAVAGAIHVVEAIEQQTKPAAETILAGAPVREDTAGKFTNANGTTTTEADVYGIATRSVVAGEALTAVKKGVLDGFTFSQAYSAKIYLSDTDGTLADTAGTVSTIVGRVTSAWATTTGTAADKVLLVTL